MCLQHCLHYTYYTYYNGGATHGFHQVNLFILKRSQFIDVPRRGIELLIAIVTAECLLLVVQG